jgi:hypothetical protein
MGEVGQCRGRLKQQPYKDLRDQLVNIGKFGVETDSDRYSSAPSSPTSNLDASSVPVDQMPDPAVTQPTVPGFHTSHPASDPEAWLTAVKGSLTTIEALLHCLLPDS